MELLLRPASVTGVDPRRPRLLPSTASPLHRRDDRHATSPGVSEKKPDDAAPGRRLLIGEGTIGNGVQCGVDVGCWAESATAGVCCMYMFFFLYHQAFFCFWLIFLYVNRECWSEVGVFAL